MSDEIVIQKVLDNLDRVFQNPGSSDDTRAKYEKLREPREQKLRDWFARAAKSGAVNPHEIRKVATLIFGDVAAHLQKIDPSITSKISDEQVRHEPTDGFDIGTSLLPVPADELEQYGISLDRPEPTPATGQEKKDINYFLQLAKNETGDIIRINADDIGDEYEKPTKGFWKKTKVGIHSWRSLGDLFSELAKQNKPVQIEINQNRFPNLFATPDFLKRLQELSDEHQTVLTLIVHGHPQDPPQIYSTCNGRMTSSLYGEKGESGFQIVCRTGLLESQIWSDAEVRSELDRFLCPQASIYLRIFEDCAQEIKQKTQTASLEQYLNLVADRFAEKDQNFQRQFVNGYIVLLREKLNLFAKTRLIQKSELTPQQKTLLAATNPIDEILRSFPNIEPESWQFLGGGQMTTFAQFIRHLVNLGSARITTRIAASDVNDALIEEVERKREVRAILGDTEVNPQNGTRVQMLAMQDPNDNNLRNQMALTYGTKFFGIHLKATHISAAVGNSGLAKTWEKVGDPVLFSPVKSFQKEIIGEKNPSSESMRIDSTFLHEKGESSASRFVAARSSLFPSIDILQALKRANSKLAGHFVAVTGFFGARTIARYQTQPNENSYLDKPDPKNRVDITLIGANGETGQRLARAISPSLKLARNHYDAPWVNLKVIESNAQAHFSMAAGAMKNLQTLEKAEAVMEDALYAFGTDSLTGDGTSYPSNITSHLNDKIRDAWIENLQTSDRLMAELLADYGVYAFHLWNPRGVVQDFRYCMPDDCQEILEIRRVSQKILLSEGTNADDFDALFQNIFSKLKWTESSEGYQKAKSIFNDSIKKYNDSEGLWATRLALLDVLIYCIQNGFGGGTRNCSDGLMTAVIKYAYRVKTDQNLNNHDHTYFLNNENFDEFWKNHHPGESWKQEGRYAAENLYESLIAHGLPASEKVLRTIESHLRKNLERPTPIHFDYTEAKIAHHEITNGRSIHSIWGLDSGFLVVTRQKLIAARNSWERRLEIPTPHELSQTIKNINSVLRCVATFDGEGLYQHQFGKYPRITRLIAILSRKLDELCAELEEQIRNPSFAQSREYKTFFTRIRTTVLEAIDKMDPLSETPQNQDTISNNLHKLIQHFHFAELSLQNKVDISGPDYRTEYQATRVIQPKYELRPKPLTITPPDFSPVTAMQMSALALHAGKETYQPQVDQLLAPPMEEQATESPAGDGINDVSFESKNTGLLSMQVAARATGFSMFRI